jgi:HEAT repeat protein
MTGTEMLRWTLAIVFALNALLLAVILTVKPLNRRHRVAHARRRSAYVALLSRHLVIPEHKVMMGRRVAEDQAFLDALIDLRTVVSGEEGDALGTIVDRFDIAKRESRALRRRGQGSRRLRSAVALAELADVSAAPTLIRHLSDREQEVRIQCARGLGRMRWTPAIGPILERFEVETPWVRSRFADTLVGFGDSATWPLLAYVRVNHRLRLTGVPSAVRTLGAIGDPLAVPPLLEILEETVDPEVQIAIVETLGQIGTPMAFDLVEKAARSEDWRLRAKAATALATLGDESVVPTLTICLEDENWWVRRNSAAALTRLRGGIDILYTTLLSSDLFARDAAGEALADAGEVIAARDRIEAGLGARRDFDLVEHVSGALVSIE